MKLIKSKISNYNPELALVDFWGFMIKKYELMSKNQNSYLIFLKGAKTNFETFYEKFNTSMRECFIEINKAAVRIEDQQYTSFDSSAEVAFSEQDLAVEVKTLIAWIDIVYQQIENTHSHIEHFIKSLYTCLASLVAYEGTSIHQNQELLKYQKEYVKSINIKGITINKSDALNLSENIMPEGVEELDLINNEEEKDFDDQKLNREGRIKVPYQTKEFWSISDNNSLIKSDDSDNLNPLSFNEAEDFLKVETRKASYEPASPSNEPNDIARPSINMFLNSGKPINSKTNTPVQHNRSSSQNLKSPSLNDKNSGSGSINLAPADRTSKIFRKIEFEDHKSQIINDEVSRTQEVKQSGNSEKDKNAGAFQKKFKPEPDEQLIDSFACAVSRKILLQGRLYITNKRLCFHSFFNNKLIFFGKDTKLTIPYDDIMSIEKRINAFVFDNSIGKPIISVQLENVPLTSVIL